MSDGTVIRHDQLYVGGRLVDPAGDGRLSVVAPATEEVIGDVPEVTTADVDAAVGAARTAFDSGPWPSTPASERFAAVNRLADAIERRAAELVPIVVNEMGAPISGSGSGAVYGVPYLLRAMVEMAKAFPYVEERKGPYGHTLVVREPVGVVGAIVPWNGPLFVSMLKLAPALLAGCTGVVKLAPETPLEGYILGECLNEAGIPEGVVSILSADRDVSEALVRDPRVDKITFTGSTAAGRRIASICGERLARYTLELGGKSAGIVLDDADLDTVFGAVRSSALGTNGQQCYGLTRVLAPRSRYAEVVDHLTEAVGGLVVGDPLDPATDIGPLISARQRDRVLGYVDSAREQGARVTVGGGSVPERERGWFVQPTVLADVDNAMRVAQEEIFGPVLCVIPYGDVDEAVAIANDSEYGLSGAVFTPDRDRGTEICRRIRSGLLTVNGFHVNFEAPFGGFKASGIGREYGPEGLAGCTELKSINLLD